MYISINIEYKNIHKSSVETFILNNTGNVIVATPQEIKPIKNWHNNNTSTNLCLVEGINSYSSFYTVASSCIVVVFGHSMKDSFIQSHNILNIFTSGDIRKLVDIKSITVNYGVESIEAKYSKGGLFSMKTNTKLSLSIITIFSLIFYIIDNSFLAGVGGSLIASVIFILVEVAKSDKGIILNNPQGAIK